jgi:HAD superfamily hydrolase (TIGR01549 family)
MTARGILFDLGDTIIQLDELSQSLADSIQPVLAAYAVESLSAAIGDHIQSAWDHLLRSGAHDELDVTSIIRAVLSARGHARAGDIADACSRRLTADDMARSRIPAARRGLFDLLRGKGLRLGIVSNTWSHGAALSAFLSDAGLLEYFTTVVYSSDERVRKPGPAIYERAASRLGVDPGDILFVGDRVREDVLGPRACGMRAALSHEFRQEAHAHVGPLQVLDRLEAVLDFT